MGQNRGESSDRLQDAQGTCFFCKASEGSLGDAVVVRFTRNPGSEREFMSVVTVHRWEERRLTLPRCTQCLAVHKRAQSGTSMGCIVGGLGAVAGVVGGVVAWAKVGLWTGLATGACAGAVLSVGGFAVAKCITSRPRPGEEGVASLGAALEHSEVAEALASGWEPHLSSEEEVRRFDSATRRVG